MIILGPGPIPLALEREFVAVSAAPDRLIDVAPSAVVDPAALTTAS